MLREKRKPAISDADAGGAAALNPAASVQASGRVEIIRKYRWLLVEKELSLSMDIDEITIQGDPAFLEKVWENLLSNALKYTPEYGEIDVSLTLEESLVIVKISDTGIGIAKENLAHIFNRFYREDDSRTQAADGTGLGLSIVQQVTELHKGTIEVTSEKGEGTIFTITLPVL